MYRQKILVGTILGLAIAAFFFSLASDRKSENSNDPRLEQTGSVATSDEDLNASGEKPELGDRQLVAVTKAKHSDGDPLTINWYTPVTDFVPPEGPVKVNFDRLKAEADAGSGVAAYVLSEMMRTCSRAYLTRENLDGAIDKLQQTHTFIHPASKKEMHIADPENLEYYIGMFRHDFEHCEGISAEQRSAHLSWLEMSANNGFPLGMIEYGKQVSDPLVSANLFDSAWKLGNGEALMHLSNSYADLYDRGVDPTANVLSYAAMQAYVTLLGSSRGPDEQVNSRTSEFRAKLEVMSGALLPRQLDEARTIAKFMIISNKNCCFAM